MFSCLYTFPDFHMSGILRRLARAKLAAGELKWSGSGGRDQRLEGVA